jgi:NAD(P)-dependent dehydrogenase (short-subunit alcohol dehydrogenase family)
VAASSKRLAQLMPLGRPVFADNIAKAVLFLASDLASYSNGISFTVLDGGMTRPVRDYWKNRLSQSVLR